MKERKFLPNSIGILSVFGKIDQIVALYYKLIADEVFNRPHRVCFPGEAMWESGNFVKMAYTEVFENEREYAQRILASVYWMMGHLFDAFEFEIADRFDKNLKTRFMAIALPSLYLLIKAIDHVINGTEIGHNLDMKEILELIKTTPIKYPDPKHSTDLVNIASNIYDDFLGRETLDIHGFTVFAVINGEKIKIEGLPSIDDVISSFFAQIG